MPDTITAEFLERLGLRDDSSLRYMKRYRIGGPKSELAVYADACEGPKCWRWSIQAGGAVLLSDATPAALVRLLAALGLGDSEPSVGKWLDSAPAAIREWMATPDFRKFLREQHQKSFQMIGTYDGAMSEECKQLFRGQYEAIGAITMALNDELPNGQ